MWDRAINNGLRRLVTGTRTVYQRDYILRLIEQLGRVLLYLRDRILGREHGHDDVREEIRAIAARVGLDLDAVRIVDAATLRLLMSFAGDLDPARCWLAAELLYLEALDASTRGDSKAAGRDAARALELYSMLSPLWQPFEELPPASERIAEVARLLAQVAERAANEDG